MNNIFISFIFEIIGAFVCWIFTGFKGNFSNQMTRPNERNSKKLRNVLVSILTVLLIGYLLKK